MDRTQLTKAYAQTPTIDLVDERGRLLAQIAELEEKVERIDLVLRQRIPTGQTADGNFYRATHIFVSSGETLDKEAVLADMGADWVSQHSKSTAHKDYIKSSTFPRHGGNQ